MKLTLIDAINCGRRTGYYGHIVYMSCVQPQSVKISYDRYCSTICWNHELCTWKAIKKKLKKCMTNKLKKTFFKKTNTNLNYLPILKMYEDAKKSDIIHRALPYILIIFKVVLWFRAAEDAGGIYLRNSIVKL